MVQVFSRNLPAMRTGKGPGRLRRAEVSIAAPSVGGVDGAIAVSVADLRIVDEAQAIIGRSNTPFGNDGLVVSAFTGEARQITHGAVTGGPFVVGELITGGTSGATASVLAVEPNGLVINNITGAFTAGPAFEVLTGGTSGATATSSSVNEVGSYSRNMVVVRAYQPDGSAVGVEPMDLILVDATLANHTITVEAFGQ